jgi:hypothetical protein
MQLRYVKSIHPPVSALRFLILIAEYLGGFRGVFSKSHRNGLVVQTGEYVLKIFLFLLRSANNMRLAVATATAERYILLYDENGVQQEKFKTKPAEKVFCMLL